MKSDHINMKKKEEAKTLPPFKGVTKCLEKVKPTQKCTGDWRKTSFFLSRLVNYLKYKHVCISASPYNFLIQIREKGEASIPPNFTEVVSSCKKPIIFIHMGLQFADGSGHSNMIIVDKNRKEYERFEPHGEVGYSREFSDHVDEVLRTQLKFPSPYNYVPTLEYCPRMGPQGYERRVTLCHEGGLCTTWSVLYAQLRLANPFHSREQVISEITKGTPAEIDLLVRKYQTFIDLVVSDKERDELFKLDFSVWYNQRGIREAVGKGSSLTLITSYTNAMNKAREELDKRLWYYGMVW